MIEPYWHHRNSRSDVKGRKYWHDKTMPTYERDLWP